MPCRTRDGMSFAARHWQCFGAGGLVQTKSSEAGEGNLRFPIDFTYHGCPWLYELGTLSGSDISTDSADEL